MEEKDLINEMPEESSTSAEAATPVADEKTIEESAIVEEAASEGEKETTQELRESYEEAVEDGKKKKKKKKKKRSKKKIALIVVVTFFVVLGVAIGLFFLIGNLLAEDYNPVYVMFNNPRPDKEITYSAEETTLINQALASNASQEKVKEAIAMMYAKANENKINAPQAIAVLRGEGKATIDFAGQHPSGTMIVRGIKVQNGNEFYYQKAAKVVESSIDAIQTILQNSLNQQERTYTNLSDTYLLTGTIKGGDARVGKPETATIPFLPLGKPGQLNQYEDYETFAEHGYYLNDPREITNFNIQKDYIVLQKGQKWIEYNAEKKYYTLRFSLLLEPGEAHEDCVRVARQYLRDSANSSNLDFAKYDVVLEIWDNGYLKKMHDDEVWAGKLDGTYTESTTWYESIIYYDFDPSIFSEEDLAIYAENIDAADKESGYVDPMTFLTGYTEDEETHVFTSAEAPEKAYKVYSLPVVKAATAEEEQEPDKDAEVLESVGLKTYVVTGRADWTKEDADDDTEVTEEVETTYYVVDINSWSGKVIKKYMDGLKSVRRTTP